MVQVEISDDGKVIALPVDREWSYIGAKVLLDYPEALSLYLMIDCRDTEVLFSPEEKEEYGTDENGYVANCSLELSGLMAPVRGWRDLDGWSIEIAYEDEQVHPILPDNPGTFYFNGRHHVPNENRLRLGRRDGCSFEVDWQFRATAHAGDPGMRVVVNTRLALRQIEVQFTEEQEVDAGVARRRAFPFAAPGDFGEPERVGVWCVLPLEDRVAEPGAATSR